MNVVKLNCTACGAPISIPENVDQLNCSACGSFLQVDRGEGYITLRVLERLTKSIETSGKATTDAIKESSYVTRTELQKLQIQQEIIANQTILANIESEIRSLKRSEAKNNINEINILYGKQYQILDKLRILEQKYLSPLPDDMDGLISAAQNEISYIDQELSILYLSNLPNKNEAIKSLQKMRADRKEFLTNIRANEIRKKFPILQQKSYEVQETQQALDYLNSLSEAENFVINLPDSPEKNLLKSEIKQLKDKLSNEWAKLEKARVSEMLHFIPPVPENEDLDSMVGKLKFMDENITILQNQNQNWVIKDLLIEQQTRRNKLQIRISKVQKQKQKEQAKLARVIEKENGGPDKKDQLLSKSETSLAEIGVILGGWWLAIKSIFIKTNPNKNLISRLLKRDKSDFQGDNSEYKYLSIEESSKKSIKKGLIYSIISLIAFSCIGSILLTIISSIFSNGNEQFTSGFLMLIIFFVFLISQKIFINQSFGLVFIEGFLGIPNLRLSTNHPSHGITNKFIVKSIVGIFTFITVSSLILTVLLFFPFTHQEELPDSAAIVLLVGFLIPPVLAIFAGIRTKVVNINLI